MNVDDFILLEHNLLYDKPINIDINSVLYNTLLHEKIYINDFHFVLKLLNHGADLTRKNVEGETPIDYINTQKMQLFLNPIIELIFQQDHSFDDLLKKAQKYEELGYKYGEFQTWYKIWSMIENKNIF